MYTAFITHHGLFQFIRMPFGLMNSGASFNRLMRKLLDKLEGVDNYVDDVPVHSCTWNDHICTLGNVFNRIREANLTIRP